MDVDGVEEVTTCLEYIDRQDLLQTVFYEDQKICWKSVIAGNLITDSTSDLADSLPSKIMIERFNVFNCDQLICKICVSLLLAGG